MSNVLLAVVFGFLLGAEVMLSTTRSFFLIWDTAFLCFNLYQVKKQMGK